MHPVLEKLLWRSPIGQEIKGDALIEVEAEAARLADEIRRLEAARDARVKELADQAAGFASQIAAARASVAEAEFQLRGLRHAELVCGYEADTVRSHCRRDVNARTVRLRELDAAGQQLREHAR